jgi:signal transduction histidine kinase
VSDEPAPPEPTPPAGTGRAPADADGPPALDALRHELRGPLNHVIGYAELLLEEAEERGLQPLVPALEAMRDDAVRALRLVNDLLSPGPRAADAVDTTAVREALTALLDQITHGSATLQQQAAALGQDEAVRDLQRIDLAAAHLRALLHERFSLAP